MKIFYHKADNDGRASAAIIYGEYGVTSMMTEADFIPYDYNRPFELPEIVPDETWFFVDIALNPETFGIIKECLIRGCKVIHIDHHRNQEYMETKMDAEDLAYMEKVTKFYDISESATLLCWIYVNMPESWRKEPMKHTYEFGPGYSHVILDDMTDRLIRIPYGFRLVNDQDVAHKEFKETPEFTAGLIDFANGPKEYHLPQIKKIIEKFDGDISPMSNIWGKIQNDDMRLMTAIVTNGQIVLAEEEKEIAKLRESAKEITLSLDGEDYKLIAIETDKHGARIAGDLFEKYDGYCRYNFDEEIQKWSYSFYSRENGKFVPCHLMSREINPSGGGHLHAGGCVSENLVFADQIK